ncbi:MAG: AAA family ATPase [Candidatus Peribacteria bacterium]|nr:AAA family ATPase [Candidatus Peribacteria bacterium]
MCPFCQKNTISKELYKEIQDYFDETYIKRVSELKDLTNNYFREYQSIKDKEIDFLNNPFIKNKENDFKVIYKALLEKLGNNWSKMNNKTKSTSQIIMLESSDKEKEELNKFLQTITEEIKTHNIKIKNKDDTRKELIETFWQIMRWEYDQTIDNYNTQKEKIRREKGGINEKINKTREEISEQEKIIQQAQKEIINIDEAIGNINRELKFLGAEGFEIVKNDNVSYKIQREEQQGANFKTLSEGEKTIISFLYFLELCKGKSEENEVIMEKIIVIDDPISSLSHMYVFNIAQLIKHNFLGDEYKQVFILTHSLYFFHELLNLIKHMYKGKNTKWKLFRFLKIQNKSYIEKMEEKEIQNDYQAYWQVLKDHEQQKSSNALLANAMRNILDHFFGFIQRDDL